MSPIDQSGPLSWNVGDDLRRVRNQQELTLRELSNRTKRFDPEERGVLAAQISRIENGAVPDLREVLLLAKALHTTLDKLQRADLKPWQVIRNDQYKKRLKEVDDGKFELKRLHERHQHMMDKQLYRYVPLEAEMAHANEREGDLRPGMRAVLFEVKRAASQQVAAGLDRHEGEEIVIVQEGELEFWYQQSHEDATRQITLREGDIIHYSSQLLHGYRAAGSSETATALFIFSEPEQPTPPQVKLQPARSKRGPQ